MSLEKKVARQAAGYLGLHDPLPPVDPATPWIAPKPGEQRNPLADQAFKYDWNAFLTEIKDDIAAVRKAFTDGQGAVNRKIRERRQQLCEKHGYTEAEVAKATYFAQPW
jgi:hypothetical protein